MSDSSDSRDWPFHDEDLSTLYRSTDAVEPPAWLDERIVAAARAAVEPPSVPVVTRLRRPWRRWSMPLALAATVVLTVGLVRLVQQSAELEQRPQPEAKALQSLQSLKSVEPTSADRAAGAVGNAAESTTIAPVVAPAAPPLPGTFGAVPQSEPEVSLPASPAPLAAPLAAPKLEQETRSLAKPARSEAADVARPRDQIVPRPPEQWLAEIAELRRLGRTAEAAAQWQAFRRQYPDYPLDNAPQPPR